MGKVRPPVKIHGGKYYLSDWVIKHFPDNYQELNYCEPYCGGANVFLNKKHSVGETINDINKGIVSIFLSLRDNAEEFIAKLSSIEYTEENFQKAIDNKKSFDDCLDYAINEYILRRMSRGGMKKTFAWSDRLRGGKPGDVNAWESMLKKLPAISNRLQGVSILNSPFSDIMSDYDDQNTFIYLDPPYLSETRSKGARSVYDDEMTNEQHEQLLSFANNSASKILISGYKSALYNEYLKDWNFVKKEIANHSSQAKIKESRVECLWFNY